MVKSKPSKSKFRVAEAVPASGIYRIFHLLHRASHEVTLLQDEKFPPCNKCGDKVYFELVRAVPAIDRDYGFKVRLFEVPHPQEEEQAEETA